MNNYIHELHGGSTWSQVNELNQDWRKPQMPFCKFNHRHAITPRILVQFLLPAILSSRCYLHIANKELTLEGPIVFLKVLLRSNEIRVQTLTVDSKSASWTIPHLPNTASHTLEVTHMESGVSHLRILGFSYFLGSSMLLEVPLSWASI